MEALPEAREPPPTTLQILGRSHQERDWQRLLFHFMTPGRAHGLEHALLEHILKALSDYSGLDYTYSPFDLAGVRVAQEVIDANDRRPDAVIWSPDEWFICWELKVDAAEGADQTEDYVDVESFRSIGLTKADVPDDEHHYVYLAPEAASLPESESFVSIAWEWIAEQLQSFLAQTHGEYPARTTAQISDFIGTIRSELSMTEYEENQEVKVELFIDYYDDIADLKQAFEDEWSSFTNTWGDRLANQLDEATVIDDPAIPDEFSGVDLELEDGERRRWVFRQTHNDWSWMFPQEWWRDLEKRESFYTYDPSRTQARVGFLHRLERNQETALRDNELRFYFRNAPAGHDDFHEGFTERFNSDPEIPALLPPGTTKTGAKANLLEATYEINTEYHDNFFDAYIEALARAVEDHIISSPDLVKKMDKYYRETIELDTPF